MIIYISHPYSNKDENKLEVEDIIKKLVKEHKSENITYVSPIHTFGFLYDLIDYQDSLKMCLDLLFKCDAMLVYGDYKNSVGCQAEIQYCKDYEIPYQIIEKED